MGFIRNIIKPGFPLPGEIHESIIVVPHPKEPIVLKGGGGGGGEKKKKKINFLKKKKKGL